MSSEYELDDVSVEATSGLMTLIKSHVRKLYSLRDQMEKAEEAFEKAKKEYLDYNHKVLPDLFKLNGIDSLQMEDGSTISVITKTQCSINKNDADRANVAKWLREHGASSIVKAECIVPSSQVEKLQANSITYEEETTMNTNSVKAFLLDQLGQKGSPATITVEDLPKGINFFQFDEMEITR